MYSDSLSARITQVLTVLFCVVLLGLMVFAPKLVVFFFGYLAKAIMVKILIAFYVCCPAAWAALYSIFRIMQNVLSGSVFTSKTVFSIRLLSWCCAFVAVVCLVFGYFWAPLLIVFMAASFMTLILRVLKNVMAKATEIKAENELTI